MPGPGYRAAHRACRHGRLSRPFGLLSLSFRRPGGRGDTASSWPARPRHHRMTERDKSPPLDWPPSRARTINHPPLLRPDRRPTGDRSARPGARVVTIAGSGKTLWIVRLIHDKSHPPSAINRTPPKTGTVLPLKRSYKFLLVMGAPLSVENSTDSANEAAQSGLRPGHPCGVPPDKPAPPPAQMAGLRPGLFARARLPPRGALRTASAGQGATRPAKNRQRERKGRNGLSEKEQAGAGVPQNGHQSAQEGRRGVFQGRGRPHPAKPSKSAYGASWGIRRACHTLNLS